jgi:hypothetical protein
MLGTRWVGFTRRNQVKNIPIQKLWTAIINCGTQMLSGSFWKKMQKLRTAIFGLAARIDSFKAVFSWELIDFDTPSSQTSLNCLEGVSKQERRGRTPLEGEFEEELKNQARNRRSSWFILFFTLFSCCTVV